MKYTQHAKHASSRGSGACPPGKIAIMRLNLETILVTYKTSYFADIVINY